MRKNLTTKIIVILADLAIFVFGIFGIPNGVSARGAGKTRSPAASISASTFAAARISSCRCMSRRRSRATTDSDAARIQSQLQQAGITVGSVTKPDPAHPEIIQIQGAPADRVGDIRTTLNNSYGSQYDISSTSGTSWTLTMKPTAVKDLETAHAGAGDRDHPHPNRLARGERTGHSGIQPGQQPDIWSSCPESSDLARVHDIIQSTARLEIHAVQGGPWPDEATALQALGGTVPYDSVLLHEPAGTAAPTAPTRSTRSRRPPKSGAPTFATRRPAATPTPTNPRWSST